MDITQLLTRSVQAGASDLHLSAGLPPMVRIDGDIQRLDVPPMGSDEVLALAGETLNEVQRHQFKAQLEIDFSFEIHELARFRVNLFNQHRGVSAVFRTIPLKAPTLQDLEAPPIFRDLSAQPHGLILATGPTGSGKSTTLAAMVAHENANRAGHILTIEDPIEFIHPPEGCLVSQREVASHSHSFANALRAALREDPDIILVGEMRDAETIRLALTAAETGHLVFGTLHTASAARAVDRIVDVFPGAEQNAVRAMLSESLRAVIAQTLVRKTTGGRMAAHEIMVGTPAIRNLIREGKIAQLYSAIQTGQSMGMQTLDQALQRLLASGHVAPNEVARFARPGPGGPQTHKELANG